MAIIMDGKKLATKIMQECKELVDDDIKNGLVPSLTICQVGDDPASNIYIKNKMKACQELGITCLINKMSDNTCQRFLEAQTRKSSANPCMLQLPVPKHLDSNKAIDAIEPFPM